MTNGHNNNWRSRYEVKCIPKSSLLDTLLGIVSCAEPEGLGATLSTAFQGS